MKSKQNLLLTLVCCCLVFEGINLASADDWPQWRGADFKSVSSEKDLPVKFNRESNMLWRLEMPGTAGSSPIVVGENVFVTSVEGDDLVLICIGTDGKQRWKKKFPGGNKNSRDGANSASASPCSDGKHVWAMMGNGALGCFTVDGKSVWMKDLQEVYGKFDIQFGMSSTPLLDNGKLYLQLMHGNMRSKKTSKGQVICLSADTGEQVWMQLRETDGYAENKHSYASPTIYREGDVEMLITHGADYVIAHSLKDGSEIWRCGGFNPHGESYNPFLRLVASPVCADGVVIAPTAKGGPVLAIAANQEGDLTMKQNALKWKLRRGTPDVSTPVVYDGIVYLAGEKGDLTCLDAKTGKQLNRARLMADKQRSTPVAADGKLYIADRRGTVFVLKAGADQEVLATNRLGEETTSSPAIANGKIFIRTFDALYCFGKQ